MIDIAGLEPHRHAARRGKLLRSAPLWTVVLLTISAATFFFSLDTEQRILALPVFCATEVILLFFWRIRVHPFPFHNIGLFAATMFFLYAVVPPLCFLLGGMIYYPWSDPALWFYQPSLEIYASVVWRFVVFLAVFCTTFGALAPVMTIPRRRIEGVTTSLVVALAIVALVTAVILTGIESIYGVELNPEYDSRLQDNYEKFLALPIVVQQVGVVVFRFSIILKLAFVIIAVSRWDSPIWRWGLVGWLVFSVVMTLLFPGARTYLLFVIIAFTISYHRFVRTIPSVLAIGGAGLLFAAFLFLGIYRGTGSRALVGSSAIGWEQIRLAFTLPNEFTVVFGGTLDVYMTKANGLLPVTPWEVLAFEPSLLIPQQLLPFTKIDPASWFLTHTPVPGGGVMFGPVAQSIVGFGWIELIGRAVLLGTIFAMMHRAFLRYSTNFWMNLFYLYMLVNSYWAVRGASFQFVYFVAIGFLPILGSSLFLQRLLKQRY